MDGVFIAVGMRPRTEIFRETLACDEGGYLIAGEDCATNVPGILRREISVQGSPPDCDGGIRRCLRGGVGGGVSALPNVIITKVLRACNR